MARPTSQKTVVSRLFAACERPIYLLDAGGRIVFANKALAEWLQIDEDRLVGMKCIWAGKDPENMLNRLAVPPQAKGESEFRTTITVGTGTNVSHRAAIFMTLNDQVDLGGFLVVVDEEEATPPESSPFDAESLHRELALLRQNWSEPYSLDQVVGNSAAIRQVRSQIAIAANSQSRILIVGNDGSGKEMIARTIHHERTQGTRSLVPINCELIDAEQLSTTLTDLMRQSKELGATEPQQRASGSLLLLNVDSLSLEVQATLLDLFNSAEFAFQTLATCRNSPFELGMQNRFHLDLAHLLTDIEIRLPSLSDRLDDIPMLAQWTLENSKFADRRGGLTAEAIEALLRYPWPREVSELKEVIEEAAANANDPLITKEDLPKKFALAAEAAALPEIKEEQILLDEFMAEVESEVISRALKQAKGNRAQAARSLGISRGKLLRRIEQLGIDEKE